jgi:putative transcriptional regulator
MGEADTVCQAGAEVMSRTVALLIAAGAVIGQPVRQGLLLVATAASHDPDFARTVVLIVHADQHGVAGLFLNRPTDVDIRRFLPDLHREPADKTVYAGGPLALGVNALVRSRGVVDSGTRLTGDIWLIANQAAITRAVAGEPRSVRVFIGQCGWSASQMENEISRRLWAVAVADADVVFDRDTDTLWKRLSARLRR